MAAEHNLRSGAEYWLESTDPIEHRIMLLAFKAMKVKGVGAGVDVIRREKDGRVYIVLRKASDIGPFSGFIKTPDGQMSRVDISPNADRDRQIALMLQDGFSKRKIEEILGKLSEAELSAYFPHQANIDLIKSEIMK